MKRIFTVIGFVIFTVSSQAQLLDLRVQEIMKDEITIGVGPSYFSFMGDIGGPKRYDELFHAMRPGFAVFAESKITQSLSTSATFEWANLQSFDRERARDFAFKTTGLHFAWQFHYNFDNNVIMPSNAQWAPYASIGMGVIAFNPKDVSGNILDNNKNFEKFGLTIPVSAGVKYKLSPKVQLRYNLSFIMTNTDYIDNFSRQANQPDFFSGHKDAFMSSTISISYVFDQSMIGRGFSRASCMERYFNTSWSFLNYFGDVNSKFNLRSNAFTFGFEQRINNHLGASINGTFGKVTVKDQNPAYFSLNRDFQTTITHGSASLLYFFDNELMISRQSIYSPYLIGGVGYMLFNPRADRKDTYGRPYYFWDNGTVMNAPEGTSTAVAVETDGIYETNLDPLGINPRSALTLHGGVGFRVKITRALSANLSSIFVLTNTDYIDAQTNQNVVKFQLYGNDAIWMNSLGLSIDLRPAKCKRTAAIVD